MCVTQQLESVWTVSITRLDFTVNAVRMEHGETLPHSSVKVLEKRVSYLNGRILLDNKLMWEVSTANCSMMCIYSIISHCAYTHKFKPVWIYATAARIHLRLQLVPHSVAKTFPLVFSDFEAPVGYTWQWINFLAQGYECEFNQSYILTYGFNKKSSPAIFTSECLLNASAN